MTRWLFFPPVLSIVLMLPALVFHNRERANFVPPIIWGIVAAGYACLCVASAYEITHRRMRHTTAITCLAQGMLLSSVSAQIGAGLLAWLGLLIFLVGLASSFMSFTGGGAQIEDDGDAMAAARAALSDVSGGLNRALSQLGVPICFTNNEGIIEEATEAFMKAIEREPEGLIGEPLSSVIDMSAETLSLPSGKWWLASVNTGAKYYVMLQPTKDGLPQAEAPRKLSTGEIILTDGATGLYTNEYRKMRGPEEVSRAQRYKRPLSGMIIELTFDTPPGVGLTPEQGDMLRTAFAQKIKTVLRTTDCGFLMDDKYRLQLLLPETPQAGAKTLMSRLKMLPQEVFDEDIRNAINPSVVIGLYFYNGASPLDYGVFTASMEEAFSGAQEAA